MEQVRTRCEGPVAIVTMGHGAKNAIGARMVEELTGAIATVRADPAVRAMVLASDVDRYFSIGLDLPGLYDLPREAFAAFMRSFDDLCLDLYSLPKPTVAALSGHATAGGAVLAVCCDRRVMATGRSVMGLNEARLGVPVPYLPDRVVRDMLDGASAREVLEGGGLMRCEDLMELGLVDGVAPPERVLAEAVAIASELAAHPPEGLAAIKRNRTEAVLGAALPRLEERRREFVDIWYSAPARERLREAMERF